MKASVQRDTIYSRQSGFCQDGARSTRPVPRDRGTGGLNWAASTRNCSYVGSRWRFANVKRGPKRHGMLLCDAHDDRRRVHGPQSPAPWTVLRHDELAEASEHRCSDQRRILTTHLENSTKTRPLFLPQVKNAKFWGPLHSGGRT